MMLRVGFLSANAFALASGPENARFTLEDMEWCGQVKSLGTFMCGPLVSNDPKPGFPASPMFFDTYIFGTCISFK